jgi:pyruvate kinase
VPKPNRRTKIVCTLGPAVGTKPQLKALIDAGMNVARINCSHGDWETRRKWIKWIKELQPKLNPVAILVDLQGPKVRIGKIAGNELQVKLGTKLTLGDTKQATIHVPNKRVFKAIAVHDDLLIGDGGVTLTVVSKRAGTFTCRAKNAGTIRSHQGHTISGKSFDIPPMTATDKYDVKEAIKNDADFIALSYVRSEKDVLALRKLAKGTKIVAKIETREAYERLDQIIQATDVVMVARGDLGLQMSLEEVPLAQKHIIAACNATATPVITATQMLESMIHAPRPTRAEASDVANAILDGTDALMLSAETAVGDYPIEAVRTMAKVAQKTEPSIQHRAKKKRSPNQDAETDSVALAAVSIASTLKTTAILTSTTSGMTPRLVSRYRPEAEILCVCWNEKTQRQLAAVWGVDAVFAKLPKGTDAAVATTISTFQALGRVRKRQKVVVTAGVPAGVPGKTNMILVLDV